MNIVKYYLDRDVRSKYKNARDYELKAEQLSCPKTLFSYFFLYLAKVAVMYS